MSDWSVIIRPSVEFNVLIFFFINVSYFLKLRCFFKMLQKNGTVLVTGDRIYGPLNWAYITVMSMGKYHLLV